MAPSALSDKSSPLDVSTIDLKSRKNVTEEENQAHSKLEMTPLEAISHGGMVMPGIPKFSSFEEHRRHILIHTAGVFRDFSHKGFTEGMSGHISVRDPEFEHYIWMNPLGKHFGCMAAGDLICLDVNTGAVVGGNKSKPANAAGFLIHSEVHKARPDIHAVCHAHTNAGRAWSVFAKPLDMLNQDICDLYNTHAVYASYGGIVFGAEEGRNIAEALGDHNKAAILMNHGLISVGSTVDEAGFLFGLLDRGCAMQLQVEAACAGNPSLKKNIISNEEAAYNFKMASDADSLYAEFQPDLEYIVQMVGFENIARGVESQRVD